MGIKTVVLSIKQGSRVVSWEGSRRPATEFRALPLAFWEAPEQSELFTTVQRTLDHSVLGPLTRVKASPGTVGWIGIDVDRRWVIDIQGMQGLDEWYGEVGTEFALPEALRQACERGPWCYRSIADGPTDPVAGPQFTSPEQWSGWEAQIKGLASRSRSPSLWVSAGFPAGWRWVKAAPLGFGDTDLQNQRVGWVLGRLLKTDWGPHLRAERRKWGEFMEDYYHVRPGERAAWENRPRAKKIAKALPPPVSCSAPKVRF